MKNAIKEHNEKIKAFYEIILTQNEKYKTSFINSQKSRLLDHVKERMFYESLVLTNNKMI